MPKVKKYAISAMRLAKFLLQKIVSSLINLHFCRSNVHY